MKELIEINYQLAKMDKGMTCILRVVLVVSLGILSVLVLVNFI